MPLGWVGPKTPEIPRCGHELIPGWRGGLRTNERLANDWSIGKRGDWRAPLGKQMDWLDSIMSREIAWGVERRKKWLMQVCCKSSARDFNPLSAGGVYRDFCFIKNKKKDAELFSKWLFVLYQFRMSIPQGHYHLLLHAAELSVFIFNSTMYLLQCMTPCLSNSLSLSQKPILFSIGHASAERANGTS